ncbi:MAG: PEP-CTERM sorting domain-containing protein [Pirellulaceae bacterium]
MARITRCGLICLVLPLLAVSTARAEIVYLTLSADVSSGSWEAFLTIDDPNGTTLGLAGIEFDVLGSGGVTVDSSTLRIPLATESHDFQTFAQKGFFNFRSDGTKGIDIRAAQDLFNTQNATGGGNNSILEGVGKIAFSESNGIIPGTDVGWPVRIASGTFSGTTGSLQVIGDPASTTLLPATLPVLGSPISTFSPSLVLGETIDIVAVPEPASIGLLVSGIVALLSVRYSQKRRVVREGS